MTKSFSTRLSIFILCVKILLFIVLLTAYFRCSSKILLEEVFAKQNAEVQSLTKSIDSILSEVELSVESALFYLYSDMNDHEHYPSLLESYMSFNEAINGAAIAFEPYACDSSKRLYMRYTKRMADGSFSTRMIREEDRYDYLKMDWYTGAKASGKPYWSEPYVDAEAAGGAHMTTFSMPLFDEKKTFVGVITADVTLDWFAKFVDKYKPYPNSLSFLLSREGNFLSNKESVNRQSSSFFKAMKEMGAETLTEVGHEMLAGKSGSKEFEVKDRSLYIFYAPIERAKWSIATISRKDDVFMNIDELNREFWIIVACGLLLIFFLTIAVIRHAMRPLVLFADSVDEISKGDFDVSLPEVKHLDEMYRLREAFVNMQSSLKSYIAELQETTATHERIDSELAIATQIQMGMLPMIFPPSPELPNLDLYASLIPAKEVGGDLFDFFAEGDTVFFTVGDASGKGVPASLLMAVTSSLFRSMAQHLQDPSMILESMNKSIAEKNDANMFITLFVGALNMRTGELLYANAGHNAPVLLRDGQASFIEVAPNLPLGVFPEYSFALHKTNMALGDTLFVYSDGLTEAEDSEQRFYSDDRLLKTLTEMGAAKTSKDVVECVMESVQDFVKGNEQSDDLTMLAVSFKQYYT